VTCPAQFVSCVLQQGRVGTQSVEKLLADLEQRNAAAREAGAGQDMTVDVVSRPCEVAQTIQDMVSKSRPRNLIAPAPTLPTIAPPRPQEEEKEEETIPKPEPEQGSVTQDTAAAQPQVVSPVPQPQAQQPQGPTSPLRHAEGSGKEVMLQVCLLIHTTGGSGVEQCSCSHMLHCSGFPCQQEE
jgi:hypothetical protein